MTLPGRSEILRLGLLACLSLAASVGWAQAPANDNFANAWAITGLSGTTNASNVGATRETGEPYHAGFVGGASVWFQWTAPGNGPMQFKTAGSDFDTVLAVYTGANLSSLTAVAFNDDVNYPADSTSEVTFDATAGTVYSVAVDGYNFGGGAEQGNITLSWTTNVGPSSAGDFLFASQATVPGSLMPLYIASERESYFPLDPRGNMTATPGARLTVTRMIGATGKVLVGYTVTNTFYTNLYTTNIFGTNTTTTSSDGSITNFFTTNIVVRGEFQNNEYGAWVYLTNYDITSIVGSNINGVIDMGITNYTTNVPPEFTCDNLSISNSITSTDAPPVTVTYLTNIFCVETNATNFVESATPFVDYLPASDQLIFDDYQMSTNILVAVFPSGNRRFPILNRVLIASITNVVLDPSESTAIPPPTASTAGTNALLNILSQVAMVIPFESNPNSGPSGTGTGVAGTNVFNFERATIRCTESVRGSHVARVYVLRTSLDYSAATSVDYRIDFLHPRTDWNNTFKNLTDWEIPLQAGSDYAGPYLEVKNGIYSDNIHFTNVTGTLNWGANDAQPQPIDIPIIDDEVVQFNEDLLLQLRLPGPKYPNAGSERSLGYVQTCNLTILFDDQPAGAVDRNYNPENSADTHPAYNLHPGPNGAVYAIATQADGKAIIGGDFTDYNGIGVINNQANIYRLARVNLDGSLDQTFDTRRGVDRAVNALAIDADGKVVLGGEFTSIDGLARNRIARVNPGGSLDTTFGFNQPGADGTVWALGIDANTGAILIAGSFTNVNTFTRHYIARLLPDGSIDPSFDPGAGPDGTIRTISVQPDGRILIGGEFTHVNGVSLNHIARLNADGTLDATFAPGTGFDGDVRSLALQLDGKVVVGGAFHSFNAYARNGLTRLDADGTLDQSFITGSGADDAVYSVLLQPDQKVLLAGIFKHFNQTRRVGIARLFNDGTVDTSFMDTAYNQFAGVVTHYWDPGAEAPNFIAAMALQPDGKVLVAGSFPRAGGGGARDSVTHAQNFTRLIGGVTPGPGNLGFIYPQYSANQTDETLFIEMTRLNGHLGPAAVTVKPVTFGPGPGNAVEGEDFAFDAATDGNPTWIVTHPGISWHLGDGSFGWNNGFGPTVNPNLFLSYAQNDVFFSLIDNTNATGNRQLNLELVNPTDNDLFLLGGEKIPLGVAVGRASAPMTIVDPHTLPGVLGFSSPAFVASETTNAIITVTRTNGSTGQVTAYFQTLDGTATNAIHYRTNWTRVTFNGGDTVKTVVVTNINDKVAQGNHTVNLRLLNPSGGATLGLSNAVLTLIDNDVPGGYVQFDSPTYLTNENAGFALVTVTRNGSSVGTLQVEFSTADGAAINGVNYSGMTNTLTWDNGNIAPQVIAIPVLNDGVVETNDLTVNLQLRSATLNGTNDPAALIGTIDATLAIANTDFRGQVAFSTATYNVNEYGGPGYVTVVRTGGSAESITVAFATEPGASIPGVDFYPTNGTLLFGPGEVSKTFTVPIIDNGHPDPARFVTMVLSNASPADALGAPSTAVLNIVDDENVNEPPGSLDTVVDPSSGVNDAVYALALQADGRLLVGGDFTFANGLARNRMARMNTDGSLDQTFSSTSPLAGANAPILAIVSQTDGRIVVGGSFTNINSVRNNFLARLALNGAIDTTFNPGAGPNNPVYAIAEAFVGSARKLLVGGAFTTFNSTSRNFIARLNNNGTLDAGFQVGLGANGNVFAIAVQPDGKAVIGGDFTAVNGVTRPHLARLNTDGSVDLTFDPGTGASDSVRAIAVQLDGRILIGGLFTNVNGAALNHVARLTDLGAVDSTFTPGLGVNDLVSSIAIQPDTRIVLGGQFTVCDGVTRHRITRLNNDGTLDTMINFGDGADSFVAAVVIQTNGMINLGGGFTHYDGTPRQHLARIYGGTVGGPGQLEFTSGTYQTLETATNTVLTVRRRGGTSGVMSNNVYVPNVSVTFATSASGSTAVLGTNYLGVTNTLTFPPGEVFQNVTIPILHDYAITPDLIVSNYLSNPTPAVPGGPGIGNQPNALLKIVNTDSGVSFDAATYFFTEDSGFALIGVSRAGSLNGPATVDFLTTTNGTALATTNYLPVATPVTFADGQASSSVQVPLLHYTAAQGDVTVVMQLSNAVGALLLNPFQSTLTIVDVDHAPGQLLFSATNYVVSEGAGFLPVTILRTNGRSGTVQVNFSTVAGTALPGLKYLTTNGVLTFGPGQMSQTFTVPILQEDQVEGPQTLSLVLSNATAGAALIGPTTVPVTILDDDVGLSFSSPFYVVPETAGTVSLAVFRQNGTNGQTTVQFATTDIPIVTTNNGVVTTNLGAQAGINYVATNGTLTFNAGETAKSIILHVLHDPLVTGDVSFGVNLTNPSSPAKVGPVSLATVILLDTEAGLSFASTNLAFVTNADLSVTLDATYGALKSSGTNLLFTVLRSNVNTGTIAAGFATADGTAQQGVDYVNTSGTLTFSNGIPFQAFTVQIVSNQFIEGDRTFRVYLTNATPTNLAFLLPPYTATVTITDDVSGLSFSSSAYSVNENAQTATITVFRSNYTNSTVAVDVFTRDDGTGTGQAGVNYWPTNGTLLFTNGETVKTFSVEVIDNHVVDGGHTVPLYLTNVVGNAVLINPNTTTLTISETDGSLIVPAGAALVSESGPLNSVIDPNETVTLLLALRNATGTNTVNLIATLLATNGVASPSEPQSYGLLATHGPSASRPFTFTASGTNGQTILATLQLRDGSTVLSNAQYSFTLGKVGNTFSNNTAIVINDNAPATPYPSVINVSNLSGLVTSTTVILTNLSHKVPREINALLVSPTGQKSYLMARCGSTFAINNVTLTFDDAATNSLPQGALITNGVYRPSSYAVLTPNFLTNAPPPPYVTNLSAFTGTSPNGAWSLYVIDDIFMDAGSIANGWILNLAVTGPVAGAADVGLTMAASGAMVVATSNLTYTLTVTNYGPSSASGIVVTDTLPPGAAVVGSPNAPAGTTVNTNVAGVVTWSIGPLAKDATATLSLPVRVSVPAGVHSVINSATVTTATVDPNPDDDNASVETVVLSPTADLVLALVGAPNPVLQGDYLTYSLMISNGGPATATNVILVSKLPPEVTFVSADPARYTTSGQTITFTNLGNLGSTSNTVATIRVQATTAGTITSFASCSSGITDPFKANNLASVKTIVQPLPIMTIVRLSGGLAISWPAEAGNYALESTTDLRPPAVWTLVTDAVPALIGGQMTVIVPIGPANQFFRLRGTTVPYLPLSVTRSGADVIIAWPINSWNCILESATDLRPPVTWSPVSSPPPQVNGGKNTVTLPIGNGSKMFRLRAQQP